MADGWALASGKRRLRQPARDGRARQRHGRAGRLQGERDAARRHRRPAGHTPSDDRAVALRRSRRARRAGRPNGRARSGAARTSARRLRRAFAIARTPPCGPVFLSLPMDMLDQEVNGPTPPASAPPRLGPSPDAARLGRDGWRRSIRTGSFVLLGDDLPAARERGPRRLRRERGGFPVLGRAAHLAHGVSLRTILAGRA